jgi:hypothetical protein
MALSSEEGTQTTTVGTEHVLNGTNPETTDCVMQFWVDPFNMGLGDYVEFRVYEAVKSGGTQRLLWWGEVGNVQSEIFVSPSVHLRNGWKVTLKQTLGTSRAFDWSIRKVT